MPGLIILGIALGMTWGAKAAGVSSISDPMRSAVEEDWLLQETRRGREPHHLEVLKEVVGRSVTLWEERHPLLPDALRLPQSSLLARIQEELAQADQWDASHRTALYLRTRWFNRELLLLDPHITGQPLLFLKRNRFICQMLHEYMGYFQDYGDVPPGGGVFVLEQPGRSFAVRSLIPTHLPPGNFTTLSLSHDGRDVYFAHAARSPTKPDYRSPERQSFHLYRVGVDGAGFRQLTDGVEDDFDPCPLPDGGVAFISTRRGGFARCNNAWEPCASYTLHRMDANGGNIRTLSVHETSEWHPSVLHDGRLVYIRWDYVDRSAAHFHGLWTSHPDGSGVASLFGNYTMQVNACYQPRAIPGSDKLVFIAGAHHADVGGSLVLLDPHRRRLDPITGEDRLEALERLTPEICFPESEGWPSSYFHSPWPLSENAFLVAYSHDPLPGMSSGETRDTRTGLYYFDRQGHWELLYRDPEISSMYPIPLRSRPTPPVLASQLDARLGDEGEFLLADVGRGHFPLPQERSIRELRVFQLLPKDGSHTANQPRIGHANAENARMLLGTVPVEVDGSAYFRAPAGKPLYFQAVDDTGRAVQGMRSATYLQPGERRGCVGCHEPSSATAPSRPTLAMTRPPSVIQPGPEGTQPFSYPLLIQPVLDRSCVPCHDDPSQPHASPLRLTNESDGPFSRSYTSLRPYLRWYEWGDASLSQITTFPGDMGADASALSRILDDANHGPKITLTEKDRRRIYLWLDANVPFYGTYNPEAQQGQRAGLPVPPPSFQ